MKKHDVLCFLKVDRWIGIVSVPKVCWGESVPQHIVKINQEIIPSEIMTDIERNRDKVRRYFKRFCISTCFKGSYIVPEYRVKELNDLLIESKKERQFLVSKLYNRLVFAKIRLKKNYPDYYDSKNYPSREKIKKSFEMSWFYFTLSYPAKGLLPESFYRQGKREYERVFLIRRGSNK